MYLLYRCDVYIKYSNKIVHTCWHVKNNATHTQAPAMPCAVFVCKKMPSPTWLNGSAIAKAAADDISVVTLFIIVAGVVAFKFVDAAFAAIFYFIFFVRCSPRARRSMRSIFIRSLFFATTEIEDFYFCLSAGCLFSFFLLSLLYLHYMTKYIYDIFVFCSRSVHTKQ